MEHRIEGIMGSPSVNRRPCIKVAKFQRLEMEAQVKKKKKI